jgi:uncharacterized membrane protein YtjA (UPF0391 family)
MFPLAIVCFVVALIAAFIGFAGIAGEFVWTAKVLFFVFLALGVLSFVAHGLKRRSMWN